MKTIRLKIKVTKDVIKRAMWCGTNNSEGRVFTNCAIALAIRDLFPDFVVGNVGEDELVIAAPETMYSYSTVCALPDIAKRFIDAFDWLLYTPEKRLELDPIEFEVDIPEKYFPEISEVHKILANCQTMELV